MPVPIVRHFVMGSVSIVFVAVLLGASQPVAADVPELKEILAILESNREALASFRVDCQVKIRHVISPSKNPIEQTASVTYYVDKSGRVRCESSMQSSEFEKEHLREAVFNGESIRSMKGVGEFRRAERDASVQDVYFQGINPRHFLTDINFRPIVQVLEEEKGRIEGVETWNGRQVIVIQTEPFSSGGREWSERFLIDPSRGFSIVKTAHILRFPPDGEWIEYVRSEVTEMIQTDSGLWLPKNASVVECGAPRAPNPSPPILNQFKITFRNWQINPELPPELFTLEYEPGLVVTDRVAGRTFKTAAITDQQLADQQLADQADYAQALEPEENGGFLRRNLRWISAGTALLLLAVVGLYWILYRR